jgi:predicted nucleotidyltransferase
VAPRISPIERLRLAHHQNWLAELRQTLTEALASVDPVEYPAFLVLLFGSRARGDWDGHSDTDLLVVASTRSLAHALADRLLAAHVGDDVIALSFADWQAKVHTESPSWRLIRDQAIPLYERPSPGLAASG